MEIKKATVDDIKNISRIHALIWKSAYKGIIPQTYLDELKEDFWEPSFASWLNDKVLTAQVMMENGNTVAAGLGSATLGLVVKKYGGEIVKSAISIVKE